MIFGKKRKERPVDDNRGSKAALKIAGFLLAGQTAFAKIAGKWINGLSVKGRTIFLVLFCIVFGSCSLYILLSTFIGDDTRAARSLNPESITIPQHLNQSGDENTTAGIVVTDEEMQKIRTFNQYIDSLKLTTAGKKVYDSILIARPGLMDSVRLLEQIYFSQQKNK